MTSKLKSITRGSIHVKNICIVAIMAALIAVMVDTSLGLNQNFEDVGLASWYSDVSPGIRTFTANMEKFDHKKMTCAIWGVPFNTILEVTNIDSGKKVFVRVNDRGPARGLHRKGRIIDLSKTAFEKITDPDEGLAKVKICAVK